MIGPQISLSNISLSFGEEPVFNNLNLLIHPRDRIALVGRNGSGKSTLLKVLHGLVIQDQGNRILSKGISIGYMEQDPDLSKFTTLSDYVYSGMPESSFHLIEITGKSLGIDLEVSISESSGGERRRVEIARTLALNPDFILLDEPFAGVDPIAVEDIQSIVSSLKKKNIGVLITDHNVRETLSITDRSYLLFDGKILKSGTSEFLANDEEARRLYLGESFSL